MLTETLQKQIEEAAGKKAWDAMRALEGAVAEARRQCLAEFGLQTFNAPGVGRVGTTNRISEGLTVFSATDDGSVWKMLGVEDAARRLAIYWQGVLEERIAKQLVKDSSGPAG